MKILARIAWTIVAGVVTYSVVRVLCDAYVDWLKSSGGIVLASEVVELQAMPWIISIVIAGYVALHDSK